MGKASRSGMSCLELKANISRRRYNHTRKLRMQPGILHSYEANVHDSDGGEENFQFHIGFLLQLLLYLNGVSKPTHLAIKIDNVWLSIKISEPNEALFTYCLLNIYIKNSRVQKIYKDPMSFITCVNPCCATKLSTNNTERQQV